MEDQYRVYYRQERPTFFVKDGDWWYCTHGDYDAEDIGNNSLEHAYGITKYDSYKDLTEDEYNKLFYGK